MNREEPLKRCLRCKYILDWLPEPRCPECGRLFDPRDPSTFLLRQWAFRYPLLFGFTLAMPIGCWITEAFWPRYSNWDLRKFAFATASAIWVARSRRAVASVSGTRALSGSPGTYSLVK